MYRRVSDELPDPDRRCLHATERTDGQRHADGESATDRQPDSATNTVANRVTDVGSHGQPDVHGHPGTDSDPDIEANANSDPDSHADTDAVTHTNPDTDSDSDADRYAHADPDPDSHANADPDPD